MPCFYVPSFLFLIFHHRGFPHQSAIHSHLRMKHWKVDRTLFCVKAELVALESLTRPLVFGPRHFVEACFKCQYQWEFLLARSVSWENLSAQVASGQLFQVWGKERGQGSLITRNADSTQCLLGVPSVLKFSTFVILQLQRLNFQSSVGTRRNSLLAIGPYRGDLRIWLFLM